MRKIMLCSLVLGLMFFVMNMSVSLLMELNEDSFNGIGLFGQVDIVSVLSAGNVYAGSEDDQGKALGHDKDKAQGKALGHYKDKKPKKPKKDKGKGPSLPALPMASSIVLGLGAIGWGRYLLKKHKG